MLFNLAQTLRSFTASPVATAIDQAHRMARRRLEAGGSAASARHHADEADFLLPPDIDPVEVAMAIEAKLHGDRGLQRGCRSGALSALATGPDGSLVVSADYVQRLGDGALSHGRRYLERLMKDIRARRVLSRHQLSGSRGLATPGG